MKKIIACLLIVVGFSLKVSGQTPEEITEDYYLRAARHCEKLNITLQRESIAIAARLTAAGDLEGAALISEQVKLKIDGLPLDAPHGTVKTLFEQYDLAKKNILAPHKQEAVQRLDGLLEKAAGKDMASILRIGKAKASVQNDEPIPQIEQLSPRAFLAKHRIPKIWGYYTSDDYQVQYGTLTLNEDGTFSLKAAAPVKGVWKATNDPTVLEFVIEPAGGQGEEKTTLQIVNKGEALMKRYSGQRYLKAL